MTAYADKVVVVKKDVTILADVAADRIIQNGLEIFPVRAVTLAGLQNSVTVPGVNVKAGRGVSLCAVWDEYAYNTVVNCDVWFFSGTTLIKKRTFIRYNRFAGVYDFNGSTPLRQQVVILQPYFPPADATVDFTISFDPVSPTLKKSDPSLTVRQ